MILTEENEQFFRDLFYTNGKGYISILRKWELTVEQVLNGMTEKSQKFYDETFTYKQFISELQLLEKLDKKDMYFSINQFMRKRESKNIWRMNAFVLDFDYYKIDRYKNLSPEEFYKNVLKNVLEHQPTYVVSSGKGIYIVYCLYTKYARGIETYYHAIYKALQNKYAPFGADAGATLLTQVIRIPGSINSKNNSVVKIIEKNNAKYELSSFNHYLPYTQEEVKAYKTNKKECLIHVVQIKSNKYLKSTESIIQDLKHLIKMRNKINYTKGYRELLIYIARDRLRFLNLNHNQIISIVTELNKMFKDPLDIDEVIRVAKPSATHKPHSKRRIIEKLAITEEEQKYLIVLKSHKNYVKHTQMKKRKFVKKTNLIKGTDKRLNRCKLIFKLTKESPSISKGEIAKRLKISERQVYRDLKYIQQHKALFVENKISFEWQEDISKIELYQGYKRDTDNVLKDP